jgi:ribose 5-phosphate isomerase B
MKIGICNDHRGFYLKNTIVKYLKDNGYEVIDYGTDSDESVDFPDYAFKLGDAIVAGEVQRGIAICGTGIGMSIALNKVKGVVCGKVSNISEAMFCRSHNNANCIAMSEDIDDNLACEMVMKFINTPFSNIDKYIRRNKKISDRENG